MTNWKEDGMSEITPAGVVAGFWRWFWVGVLGLVLAGGVVYGVYRAGWFFTDQNVNRTNHLIQNGYANQSGLQAEITSDIGTVDTITVQIDGASGQQLADLQAQRLAAAGDACRAASQVASSYSLGSEAGWVRVNCSAGNVSLTSPLRKD